MGRKRRRIGRHWGIDRQHPIPPLRTAPDASAMQLHIARTWDEIRARIKPGPDALFVFTDRLARHVKGCAFCQRDGCVTVTQMAWSAGLVTLRVVMAEHRLRVPVGPGLDKCRERDCQRRQQLNEWFCSEHVEEGKWPL